MQGKPRNKPPQDSSKFRQRTAKKSDLREQESTTDKDLLRQIAKERHQLMKELADL